MTVGDIQNRLRGGQNVDGVLMEARVALSANSFAELLRWLWATGVYWRKSFHPPYPKLEELHRTGVFNEISLPREIRWAAAYLMPHDRKILTFIGLSEKFERAFLSGDLDQCEGVLTSVEGAFGYSLWLIKRRVVLLQARSGLDGQKQYSEAIAKQLPNSISAFVAYYTGVVNEPTVTLSRFLPRFHGLMVSLDADDEFRNYLRYLIHPIPDLPIRVAGGILRMENAGAVVDYYETFVRMVHRLSATDDDELVQAVRRATRDVLRHIKDPRLAACMAVLDGVAGPEVAPGGDSVRAYDCLLAQDTAGAAQAAEAGLQENPCDADCLVIAARAHVRLGEVQREDSIRPLTYIIVEHLQAVLEGEGGHAEHINELHRLALNFFGSGWAYAVRGILEDEESSTVEPEGHGFMHLAALSGGTLHPQRGVWMPPGPGRERYAVAVGGVLPGVVGSQYLDRLARGSLAPLDSVSEEEKGILEARIELATGSPDSALRRVTGIVGTEQSAFYRRRAARIVSNALLTLGRLAEAAEAVTAFHLRKLVPAQMLPIRLVAMGIVENPSEKTRASVSTSIVLDLYSQHIDRELDTERAFAYQDFLAAHGVDRPSGLRVLQDEFPSEELVYFLRYVCVESVMDRSVVFQSSREVMEERLAVCQLLSELSDRDASVYLDEITSLIRRLKIQSRMKEIEQSKIYVDVESIRRTVGDDLRDTYGRYVALKRARAVRQTVEEAALIIFRKVAQTESGERVVLRIPSRETAELLEAILIRTRDEYVSSPEHGLDKYLSVRVRHGTLTAHLRRPLEVRHLITPREVGSPLYKRNAYWADRLNLDDVEEQQAVLRRLGELSGEFDELVEEVRTWAQVRKDGSGPGMFDFTMNAVQVTMLSEYLREDLPFEEALNIILTFFGSVLDRDLEQIRERLDREAKNRASELLDRLAADLEAMGNAESTGRLVNEIRSANIDLRVEFDRVSSWFRRSQVTANTPFPLVDAIDTGTEAVRVMSREFDADTVLEGEDPPLFAGALFATFVDMFLIIFGNIVRHSGTVTPLARVHVRVTRTDVEQYTTWVRVENDVAPGVRSDDARNRVEAIRAAIDDERYATVVTREGGTGFHKLQRLITHDLGVRSDLQFGFSEEDTFSVRFSLPIKVVEVDV